MPQSELPNTRRVQDAAVGVIHITADMCLVIVAVRLVIIVCLLLLVIVSVRLIVIVLLSGM